jgi:probable HAF family extracellular repeat protein
MLAFSAPCLASVQYTVTNLSALLPDLQFAPQTEYATAINDNAQIVVDTSNGYAFLDSGGAMTELGGPSIGSSNFVSGNAINSSGDVVGTINGQPFLYNGTLSKFLGGSTVGDPAGINSLGEIVGNYTPGTTANAFSYTNGTVTNVGGLILNTPYNPSEAHAVNSTGEVVGVMYGITGPDIAGNPLGVVGQTGSEAFFIDNGPPSVFGTAFGATGSCATSVNDAGQAVGYYYTTTGTYAFLLNGGAAESLGELSSSTNAVANLDINASGEIVSDLYAGQVGAFLDNGAGFTDLNTLIPSGSDWTLLFASAINDDGQIVGYGTGPDGNTDAFLLTPVPEPSGIVLIGVAFIGLVRHRAQSG